ncbi:MAG TPA: hypothetical protein DER01_05365 [Phycisphaerales bacterium]|nr:hypothetical protein [Phycisphaerales bacterium]
MAMVSCLGFFEAFAATETTSAGEAEDAGVDVSDTMAGACVMREPLLKCQLIGIVSNVASETISQ